MNTGITHNAFFTKSEKYEADCYQFGQEKKEKIYEERRDENGKLVLVLRKKNKFN